MSHSALRQSLMAQLDAASAALAQRPDSQAQREHYADLLAQLVYLEGARALAREIAGAL